MVLGKDETPFLQVFATTRRAIIGAVLVVIALPLLVFACFAFVELGQALDCHETERVGSDADSNCNIKIAGFAATGTLLLVAGVALAATGVAIAKREGWDRPLAYGALFVLVALPLGSCIAGT